MKFGKKKKKQVAKIVTFVLEAMLLVVLAIGAHYLSRIERIVDKVEQGSQITDKSEVGIIVGGSTGMDSSYVEKLDAGYTNIAIFGLDNRKGGQYSKGLSDVIMVASINNETKEVRLVSVYRDTYLSTKEDKFGKANTAYSGGGVKRALSMLNRNLDLNITQYVCVDWVAVVEAIDALGGVEIDIDSSEKKYINYYLWEIDKATGQKTPEVTKTGKITLTGAQATAYSRIRYTGGGDFKRASRQRIVMEAMLNKAKTASIDKLLDICDEVFDDIKTNIPMEQIMNMALDVPKYKIGISAGFPFELVTRDISGSGDTVIPVSLERNVIRLHKTLFDEADYTPSYSVKAISNIIMKKTGVTENTKPANTDKYDNVAGDDGT